MSAAGRVANIGPRGRRRRALLGVAALAAGVAILALLLMLGVDRGWRALKVDGPLPLTMTGVTAKLTTPLASAGIPVFALSTYDTDYLLIKSEHLERAVSLLKTRFRVVE